MRVPLFAVGLALLAATTQGANAAAQTRFQSKSARDAQLVPDSTEILRRARDLQARFERRRRQLLPKFYTGVADRCVIVGRFCEWHPRIEEREVPEEGQHPRGRAALTCAASRTLAAFRGR